VVSLRVGTRAEPDFVILDKAKGSFRFVEIKKGIWSVSARKTLSYVQKRLALVDYGTETLSELTKVARPIEVEYLNQALVETLLGSTGKYVLGRVLSVVNRIARGADWPLDKIEVCYVHDSEVQDWEYVLLLLVFTCDFDTADRYLHELYDQIDVLNSKLSAEEQEILQRMIFFDIEAKASLSST